MNRSYKIRIAAGAIALTSMAAAGSATAATATAHGAHAAKAASPAAVGSAFDASGIWALAQSNGPTVTMHLSEDPAGNLSGYAESQSPGSTVYTSGTVAAGAQVDGNYIIFTVDWSTGKVGQYTAAREADGTLYGTTIALTNTAVQATWWTYKTF